jgi:thiol-disulfide isomerase/thioredoxin
MHKIRDRVALAVAILLGLGAMYFGVHWQKDSSTQILPADVLAPGVLYASSFPDLAGKSRALGEWQGKIMVLNLWATWCEPCREEIPIMIKLQEKYRERGLTVIGLAMDDPGPVEKYAQEMRINYPILIGDIALGEFGRRLGNSNGGLPYTVIIDRSGKVITTRLGGVDEKFLEQALQPLLNLKT